MNLIEKLKYYTVTISLSILGIPVSLDVNVSID
jgi:hypothetical protein